MATQTVELDIQVLLPSAADEKDSCRERLLQSLAGVRGLEKANVEEK